MKSQRGRSCHDLRDRAVAADGADELVHLRVVVASRGEAWEVAHVNYGRGVVARSLLALPFYGQRHVGDGPAAARACRAVAPAWTQARVGGEVEAEGAGHPDRTKLLGE